MAQEFEVLGERHPESFEFGKVSTCPVIAGKPARSMTCAPGSISQTTSSCSPSRR